MSHTLPPEKLTAHPSKALKGKLRIPGDKSMSHRSLILGLLSVGETQVSGLLEGADILATARACGALGASVERQNSGVWNIRGVGVGGLLQPKDVLDFGNAGTGSRLMMGVVAGHGITATFDGDASLRRRPMMRVLTPLLAMGAEILDAADGTKMPLVLKGSANPAPIAYESPVASAQVKSAVLLAGLNCAGETVVIEKEATRDHSERMLRHFGASVQEEPYGEHGRKITLQGRPELKSQHVAIPADPSSAAFPMVAALIVKDSEITLEGVMLNPLRTGLFLSLQEMGAKLDYINHRIEGGEDVADIIITSSDLKGIDVPASRAPSMIDEYPILAVAASFATGETRMRGLAELRVKESDRLAAVLAGLLANGVDARIEEDDLIVTGAGKVMGGGLVETHLDHRIAMSFLMMGLGAEKPVAVDDIGMITTSFPDFVPLMAATGADLQP